MNILKRVLYTLKLSDKIVFDFQGNRIEGLQDRVTDGKLGPLRDSGYKMDRWGALRPQTRGGGAGGQVYLC